MFNKKRLYILLSAIIFVFAGYHLMHGPILDKSAKLSEKNYIETRAAIDIGSGSSNLKIAKVNTKTHKIVEKIFEKSIPVSYQKHLEKSTDQTLDQEVMHQGLAAMHAFKKITDEQGVKKVVAVATAAFRQAKNANEFAKKIEAQTGIHVWIIDQDLEGILAFEAAMATTDDIPSQSVVWDIGGGSVQFTTKTTTGEYVIQKGTFASIPFRNGLISEIQQKNVKMITSPNPVSESDFTEALKYIKKQTLDSNPYIMHKIKEPNTKILAVGSLFNYGIKPLINSTSVTQESLEEGVKSLLNKSDEQLDKGSFNDITVSDPLLILGYMKAYDIHNATILQVNNADGAISYPAFWTK
jgi:exopolyphosphatase / guanosine-5'-triphosphate,3'-diphosphate pyrophosphatase